MSTEPRVVLEEWHHRIPEYEPASGARPQVIWPSGAAAFDARTTRTATTEPPPALEGADYGR